MSDSYFDPTNDPNITNGDGDNLDDTSDGWVPDSALENLVAERSVHPGETNVKTTKRLIEENAPLVVQSIIRLAMCSKSERTRLDAGKYVLDRALGRIEPARYDEEDDILKRFFDGVTVEDFEGTPNITTLAPRIIEGE